MHVDPHTYLFLGDITLMFDSEQHCWWCSCQTLCSSAVHSWLLKICPGEERLMCRIQIRSCDPGSSQSHDPAPASSRWFRPSLRPPPMCSTSHQHPPSSPSLSSLNISQRAHWSSAEAAGGCLGRTKAVSKQNTEVALAHPMCKDCILFDLEMFLGIPQQSRPFVVCASEEQLSFSWFLIFGTVVWLSFFEQASSLQELCSF